MLTIHKTRGGNWVISQDGYSPAYRAMIQGARRYRLLLTPEAVRSTLERNGWTYPADVQRPEALALLADTPVLDEATGRNAPGVIRYEYRGVVQ